MPPVQPAGFLEGRWPPQLAALLIFRHVDQRRDQHQRESDKHPVLKRDAQKRDLPYQPVVHRYPPKDIYQNGRAILWGGAHMNLTIGKLDR